MFDESTLLIRESIFKPKDISNSLLAFESDLGQSLLRAK